jgi:hypothetical protein
MNTADENAISASTLNITKIVSVLVVISAGITQYLAATRVISLSTTLQLTTWLVAAGLIVLLSIADMSCRAYVTAKRYGSGEASVARLHLSRVSVREQGAKDPREAELLGILTGGPGQLAHVRWKDANAGDGEDAWVRLDDVGPLKAENIMPPETITLTQDQAEDLRELLSNAEIIEDWLQHAPRRSQDGARSAALRASLRNGSITQPQEKHSPAA